MNIFVVILLSVYFLETSVADEYSRRAEAAAQENQQVELWKRKLADSALLTNPEKLEVLSLGLRNLGYRRSFPGHSQEVDLTYHNIQSLLLSLPGHAEYFASEIKREQAAVKGIPANTGDRVMYDRHRSYHFRTLQHLPSPETIRVLGEFLSDEIDVQAPSNPTDDWGENPRPNCWSAAATIMLIGLRDAPVDQNTWRGTEMGRSPRHGFGGMR